MYMKLDESNKETLERISNITDVDYEIQGDFVEVESLMTALKDMLVKYDKLEEDFEDYKTNYDDEDDPHDVWWEHQQGLR